ncbi:hypothetical protein DES45_101705 [Microvirga subterranea]|uniref:Uncharacterized protein n=1 Tax=Microvirga subterranea TaxID=186651 RepID=A0A370HVJ5_9HYPH|nr:hypothetical protein DES45_101705 [Microvirga subterranea]
MRAGVFDSSDQLFSDSGLKFHPHAHTRAWESGEKTPENGSFLAQREAIAAAAPAMTVPVVRLRIRMAFGLVKSRLARAASPI